ncbi:CDP-glycerol glycerophosphotransferase family protein [Bacillus vallismortis]|uniref:CDP-glycerol glycerophosphotransferase family protein n=1 Tax=Bacillus vallismortis TaxID=72361 RepID=UPI00227FE555|nr:CDP-glycerol glycerophosphotransferase family protein [Bacillus vallismortis]MCY8307433.1 CDP-glycerol glycerophosphotransferase family protein [Bacillus vallismortis]MCY8597126.1 CDP-glycerol glycerophosphotransferase family protein [Bacillus vallismortis]
MDYGIYLINMKVENENIVFDLMCEKKDFYEHFFSRIENVALATSNRHIDLLSNISLLSDEGIMKVVIPLDELKSCSDKSVFKLKLILDKDEVFIDILNQLNDTFKLVIDGSVLEFAPGVDGILMANKTSLSESAFVIENVQMSANSTTFIGSHTFLFLNSSVKFIKCYLENEATKEQLIIPKNSLLISEDSSFEISLTLNGYPLYQGNWYFYTEMKIGEYQFTIKVKTDIDTALQTKEIYTENGELFVHNVSQTQNKELLINISRFNAKLVQTKIHQLSIDNNDLHLNCEITPTRDEQIFIKQLVFINRKTVDKHIIRLQEKDYNNGFLQVSIPLLTQRFFETDGIWDVYLEFDTNGLTVSQRLSFDSENDKSTGKFISLPKTIYNSKGFIKRARMYATLDNNLAVLIKDSAINGEISYIHHDGVDLIVKGSIEVLDKEIEIKNVFLANESEQKIYFINNLEKTSSCWHFESRLNIKKTDIEAMNHFIFDFYISILVKNQEYAVKLKSNLDDILDKSQSHVYPEFVIKDIKPFSIQPKFNQLNELSFVFSSYINAECTDIISKNKEIEIHLSIEKNHLIYDKMYLKLKDKNSRSVLVEPAFEQEQQDYKEFVFILNEDEAESYGLENQMQYDVGLCLLINNKYIDSSIKIKDLKLINSKSTFKSGAIKINKSLFLSAFIDKRNALLKLEMRDIKATEKKLEKIRFLFAGVIAKVLKPFAKKPVWFVGENLGEVAQDNGFAFFEYCVQNKNQEKYYYVSKKDNKNPGNISKYPKNIITYDSFKHLVFYHLSKYLIVSHGIRDVIPSVIHNKMSENPKDIIYLQHGIIAMKKLSFNRKSYNSKIKKFVVSSDHEKQILVKDMNFKKDQIMVTGLSRFDTLIDDSKKMKSKQILLIPTWREWIDDFENSSFYLNYSGFLNNKKLHKLLEDNNIILKFFMHIELQKKYSNYFEDLHKNIKLVQVGEESVKSLVSESSLMITDYSSVAFDFNYLEKPVIFYQFDLPDYLHYRGSYINLKTDLFGQTAYTDGSLLEIVQKQIENDFKYEKKYKVKSKKFYKYQDKQNSERIYNQIKLLK